MWLTYVSCILHSDREVRTTYDLQKCHELSNESDAHLYMVSCCAWRATSKKCLLPLCTPVEIHIYPKPKAPPRIKFVSGLTCRAITYLQYQNILYQHWIPHIAKSNQVSTGLPFEINSTLRGYTPVLFRLYCQPKAVTVPHYSYLWQPSHLNIPESLVTCLTLKLSFTLCL